MTTDLTRAGREPAVEPNTPGYFEHSPFGPANSLVPTDLAAGGWDDEQLRGMAVSAALARAIETEAATGIASGDYLPTRWTVDLYRPTRDAPVSTNVQIVRAGRRLQLWDAHLIQSGEVVARANVVLLRSGDPTTGRVWGGATEEPEPPPTSLLPVGREGRLYRTGHAPWAAGPTREPNDLRKQIWILDRPTVTGEQCTAFQCAAAAADVASLVLNWGSAGLEFINADLSLHLCRLPEGGAVGVAPIKRLEGQGVMSGVTAIFDRRGEFGTVTIAALANSRKTVDPVLFLTR